jgi:hypothetical protein
VNGEADVAKEQIADWLERLDARGSYTKELLDELRQFGVSFDELRVKLHYDERSTDIELEGGTVHGADVAQALHRLFDLQTEACVGVKRYHRYVVAALRGLPPSATY